MKEKKEVVEEKKSGTRDPGSRKLPLKKLRNWRNYETYCTEGKARVIDSVGWLLVCSLAYSYTLREKLLFHPAITFYQVLRFYCSSLLVLGELGREYFVFFLFFFITPESMRTFIGYIPVQVARSKDLTVICHQRSSVLPHLESFPHSCRVWRILQSLTPTLGESGYSFATYNIPRHTTLACPLTRRCTVYRLSEWPYIKLFSTKLKKAEFEISW